MVEEILLRIGADGRAMIGGLQRLGAYAKAWGTTLAEDFKSRIGRIFAAGFLIDKGMEFGRRVLEGIQEKILEIKRIQNDLPGTNTNFIQNMFNHLEQVGLKFEDLSKPLITFKRALDAARANPQGKEMEALQRFNIITDAADLKTQKFSTSIAKLSDAYLRFGKNLSVLKDLGIKPSPALLSLLELGPDKLEAMNQATLGDINPQTINLAAGLFGANKSIGQVIKAQVANALERSIGVIAALMTQNPGIGSLVNNLKKIVEARGEEANKIAEQNAALAASLDMEEQKVAVNTHLLELMQRQKELQDTINDQNKDSIATMAADARKLLGIPAPRNYTVSSRMRTALQITTLEEKARIAFERGDDAGHDRLTSEALQMRKSLGPEFMAKDRNPMEKTESQLTIVNQQLAPVKEMADFVNQQHK